MEENYLYKNFGDFNEQRLDIRDIVDQTRHFLYIIQPLTTIIIHTSKLLRWHNVPLSCLTLVFINILIIESDTSDILVAISGIYTFACLVGILNLKHRLLSKVLPSMDLDAEYNNVSQAVNMRDLRIILSLLERSLRSTNNIILRVYSLIKWDQHSLSFLTYTFFCFPFFIITLLPLRLTIFLVVNILCVLKPVLHVRHLWKESRKQGKAATNHHPDNPLVDLSENESMNGAESDSFVVVEQEHLLESKSIKSTVTSSSTPLEQSSHLNQPTHTNQSFSSNEASKFNQPHHHIQKTLSNQLPHSIQPTHPNLRRRFTADVSNEDEVSVILNVFSEIEAKEEIKTSVNSNNNLKLNVGELNSNSRPQDPTEQLQIPPMSKASSTPSLVENAHLTTPLTICNNPANSSTFISVRSSPKLTLRNLLNKNSPANLSPISQNNFLSIQRNILNSKVPAIMDKLIEFKKRAKNSPSGLTEKCHGCQVVFTAILKRRHVCNCCGQHFCWKCCCQKVPRAKFGATAPAAQTETVAVCMACLHMLVENKDTLRQTNDQTTMNTQDRISNKHVVNKDPAVKHVATVDEAAEEVDDCEDLKIEDRVCVDGETSKIEMLGKSGIFRGTLSKCSPGAKSYEDIKKLAPKSEGVIKSETDLTKTLSTHHKVFYDINDDDDKTKMEVIKDGFKALKVKPPFE